MKKYRTALVSSMDAPMGKDEKWQHGIALQMDLHSPLSSLPYGQESPPDGWIRQPARNTSP